MNPLTSEIIIANLKKVLSDLLQAPSKINAIDESHQRGMIERNWAFEFYLAPKIMEYADWLEDSDEHSNYTYGLRNIHHLIGWVSCVTSASIAETTKVIQEIIDDSWLIDLLTMSERQMNSYASATRISHIGGQIFGRRIGWYAVARLKKPKLIIETGVDRGIGAAVLCRALMRNAEEGAPGRYLGTDINLNAGYLLAAPLNSWGRVVYGDSVSTLSTITERIDLFINDSDHSAEYEALEYDTISNKLAKNSVILGDNSHVTDKLFRFAMQREMKFLHFAEQPDGHWYPGAGIGAAF